MPTRLGQKVVAAAQVVLFALTLSGLSPEGSAMPRHPGRDFDGHALSGVNAETFPKWFGAMGRTWAYASTTEDICKARMRRVCGLDRWHDFLADLEAKDDLTRLRSVNAFVNRVPYNLGDLRHYVAKPGDTWESVAERFHTTAISGAQLSPVIPLPGAPLRISEEAIRSLPAIDWTQWR